jgi:hypothetical protein
MTYKKLLKKLEKLTKEQLNQQISFEGARPCTRVIQKNKLIPKATFSI